MKFVLILPVMQIAEILDSFFNITGLCFTGWQNPTAGLCRICVEYGTIRCVHRECIVPCLGSSARN